jgi:hypothetical protein
VKFESGDSTVRAILNTEAIYSLGEYKLLKSINPNFKKTKSSSLVCANNTSLAVVGSSTLRLKMGKNVVEHNFYVIKDKKVPCFIGADFIQKIDMVIHLSVNTFWKEQPFTCNEVCNQAFQNLNKAIIEKVVLVEIDYSKPIKLTGDSIGRRAALLQITNE